MAGVVLGTGCFLFRTDDHRTGGYDGVAVVPREQPDYHSVRWPVELRSYVHGQAAVRFSHQHASVHGYHRSGYHGAVRWRGVGGSLVTEALAATGASGHLRPDDDGRRCHIWGVALDIQPERRVGKLATVLGWGATGGVVLYTADFYTDHLVHPHHYLRGRHGHHRDRCVEGRGYRCVGRCEDRRGEPGTYRALIYLPAIAPTVALVFLMASMGAMQIFEWVYMLAQVDGAITVMYSIYHEGFLYAHQGMASAQSVMLVVVVGLMAFAQRRFQTWQSI
jgi:hypothetical protein